jgi:hemerythrin
MAMFELTDEYLTGVQQLDDQHREILARFGTLVRVLRQDEATNHLSYVLSFLRGYAASHFRLEQETMTKFEYPDFLEHKAQHDSFEQEFVQLGKEMDHYGASNELAEHVSLVVTDLLLKHIQNHDLKMAGYLGPLVKEWRPL